jgi:alkylation response protein AidB-like acyl-CoA dehydrogenase
LLSRRDLAFLLFDWLHADDLVARPQFREHDRAVFVSVLELCEQIATEQFAPHYRRSDSEEPIVEDGAVRMIPEVAKALEAFGAAGLVGSAMPSAVGGMQLPHTVAAAGFMWFQAANISTASYPFLTVANANLLLEHGSAQQIDTWVKPMVEGRFFGTMCISETQAGSSLGDLRTRAEKQPDGTYRLFGSKMWISGGDHELSENIVHLVLARTSDAPAGTKGLSLFVVPKFLENSDRNDVTLVGLNHKMGYRGITNTVLAFGDATYRPGGRPGAVGTIVGEPGQGLPAMFHMMNEARIGVGSGAAALAYTGFLRSLEYARSRPQGRPATAKDPRTPQVPIVGHADVKRMLLAQKSYAEGAAALILYCARLLDEQNTAPQQHDRQRARMLLDILTPVAKSWPSQWCLEANNLAIQVHGGYGYSRDYDVEQLYRDNRLNLIHEGTNGIQSLDLLGRKVHADGGARLQMLVDAMSATIERATAHGGAVNELATALANARTRVVSVTDRLWSADDIEVTLANSAVYLDMLGHVVIAWIWLEQVLAAGDHTGDFYDGKRAAATYFFRYELPRTAVQAELLASLDRTTLDLDPAAL